MIHPDDDLSLAIRNAEAAVFEAVEHYNRIIRHRALLHEADLCFEMRVAHIAIPANKED